jgi:hypothetical protein
MAERPPHLRCPGCGKKGIPTTPFPSLEQRVFCVECGYQGKFGAILRWIVETTRARPERSDPQA